MCAQREKDPTGILKQQHDTSAGHVYRFKLRKQRDPSRPRYKPVNVSNDPELQGTPGSTSTSRRSRRRQRRENTRTPGDTGGIRDTNQTGVCVCNRFVQKYESAAGESDSSVCFPPSSRLTERQTKDQIYTEISTLTPCLVTGGTWAPNDSVDESLKQIFFLSRFE